MSFWKPGTKNPIVESATVKQLKNNGMEQVYSAVGEDETTVVSKEIVSKLSKGTMSMKVYFFLHVSNIT